MQIPFHKLNFGKEEEKAVIDCFRTGWIVMGAKTQEFEKRFAEYVGAKYAVFVDSGTSALDLSLKWVLKSKQVEKVCVPSLTFTSTAEVVVNNGLKPCFHDVKDYLFNFNMDQSCPNALSIPVHLTGVKCGLSAPIYDSAHRISKGDVKGSKALWCYSLYATKNMSSIQGGMIALNDEQAYLWLKKARDHGISKGTTERYKDGDCLYSIEFVGWREKSDDVHAAVGIEQLKKLPKMDKERERIVKLYNKLLGITRTGLHLYPILVNNRPEFIKFMKMSGIQVSVHFLPLHKMQAYEGYAIERFYGDGEIDAIKPLKLPNTEFIGEHICSLPLWPAMKKEEVEYVCKKVRESKLMI